MFAIKIKIKRMKNIKQFTQLLSVLIFLTSCRTTINNDNPEINTEENINEYIKSEKKKMEIKFIKLDVWEESVIYKKVRMVEF